jgi:lysozyme family protein
MSRFDYAVDCVLHHEGGYVDHKNDPGGATNFGISLRFLQGQNIVDGDFDGDGDVDAADIAAMSREDAKKTYKAAFWIPNKIQDIKSSLIATKVFDMAVNMGGKQAWKLVQRSCTKLGVVLSADGIAGPKTIAGVNSLMSEDYILLREIRKQQMEFYEGLVSKKPKLAVFALGWYRRAAF